MLSSDLIEAQAGRPPSWKQHAESSSLTCAVLGIALFVGLNGAAQPGLATTRPALPPLCVALPALI
jgi:hypothetical protein